MRYNKWWRFHLGRADKAYHHIDRGEEILEKAMKVCTGHGESHQIDALTARILFSNKQEGETTTSLPARCSSAGTWN